MKKNILLLTSTIKPNANQPGLKLTNPDDRLEDYRKALVFYTKALNEGRIDGIVFVDNSGYDLKCLSDDFLLTNIEWISFHGLDYPSSYHRGYGEFKLVDYAFSNSIILKGLNQDDVVWKITGRYIVKNLKGIIKYAPRKFDLYCDIKKNWLDMGVMAWNSAGYAETIKGVSENFKTSMPPELIMSKLILAHPKLKRTIITNYYWKPLIIGRRGFDGGQFQGKFTHLKFLLLSSFNWLRLPFRGIF
jgi:hypothetical protein